MIRSHPAWGAWIEMKEVAPLMYDAAESHPAWGAWIEIIYIGFGV